MIRKKIAAPENILILGLGGVSGSGGLTVDTGALPLYLRLVE